MDDANQFVYPGHNLLNMRANLPLTRTLELNGQITNLLDTRYAEGASVSALGEEFTPGAPRSLSLAVQYRWQR
jgi:outer membrane receptor protein involved in Fe transport